VPWGLFFTARVLTTLAHSRALRVDSHLASVKIVALDAAKPI
jgi:hypothetical protein